MSGYHLGSVESHRLLDASELDRVKYIVEVLRSENVAIKEVLEQVVSSTKSELVSMNSRFTAAFGELRDMLGNVNHQDFSTMKREIDRLCDHAMSLLPNLPRLIEQFRPCTCVVMVLCLTPIRGLRSNDPISLIDCVV